MKMSVLMLTYNAPYYVFQSILGVHKTKKRTPNLELIVLDNSSKFPTKILLRILKSIGLIDKNYIISVLLSYKWWIITRRARHKPIYPAMIITA